MRAAKVQASLRIRAVSPEPSLLAHTSSESRGTCRRKARSLAPLNGWACAVKICHDGMLEDTNSLDGAHFIIINQVSNIILHPLSLVFLTFKIKYCLTDVFEKPGGGTHVLNVMAIQHHANVSKQGTLLADVDVAPLHGAA